VLHRAYVAPAATLEKAAEVLDLPSSTFRRLLTTGIAGVTDLLWPPRTRNLMAPSNSVREMCPAMTSGREISGWRGAEG
jgi:hypothetical protein